MTCNENKRCGTCPSCLEKKAFVKIYKWFPCLNKDIPQQKKDFEAFVNEIGYGEPIFKAISTLREYYLDTPPRDTPNNIFALLSILRGMKKVEKKKHEPTLNKAEHNKKVAKLLETVNSRPGVKLNTHALNDAGKEAERQTKLLQAHCLEKGIEL